MSNGFLYKNKFIIGGAIALAIVGIIVYKTRPRKKDSTMEEDFKLGNTTSKEGDLIFSMPISKFKEYPIVIVFGGISFATPTWIMNEVPKELLSKAIFVFAPYTMSYDTVSLKLNDFIAKNKLLIKDISVIGFSAGGLNVQKAPLKQFKFVGLIDPSTRPEYVGLPFTNISKMVYNDGNWGGFPKIKETLPKLAQSVKSGGGDSEKVSLSHAKIPSYFFNKYKNEIV
jgi:hypothetical protein